MDVSPVLPKALTVAAHFINSENEKSSSTNASRATHYSTHLAEELQEAVAEWKLERPRTTIAVTTDKARNIVNAVNEAGLVPYIL